MNWNTHSLYADRVLPLQQLSAIRFYYSLDILSSAQQAKAGQISFSEAGKRMQTAEKIIARNWKSYNRTYLTPEEELLAKQTSSDMEKADVTIQKLKKALAENDNEKVENIINKEIYLTVQPVITNVNELINLQLGVSDEINQTNHVNYSKTIQKFVLLIILCLVFALPFSYYLIRNVRQLIVDLRQSNEKIKTSEEKWRAFIKYAGDINLILNEDMLITEVNDRACEVLKYSREELKSLRISEILVTDEDDSYSNSLSDIEEGKRSLQERKLRSKNGDTYYTEVNVRTLEGTGYIAIIRDITDRKRAEAALRKSEENFRSLVDHAADAIFMVTDDGVIFDVNKSALELLGYTKSELIGKSVLDLHPPEERTKMPALWETLRRRKSLTDERKLQRKDDTLIEVEISRKMLPDSTGAIAIVRDITERKKAEEDIRLSEANYRQLFEKSPVPMWVVEPSTHKFLQVNNASVNKYGYSEEEFTSMKVDDIILTRNFSDFENAALKSSGRGFPGNGKRHVKKSGELIEVETSGIPVVLNGEEKLLIIAIDVTEKKQYEQKLTRASIKAQEDERYEIGGELHDNVCQILATSSLYLDLMRQMLPPEAKEYFLQAHQNINSASQEIRNLSHRLAPAFFDDQSLEDAFSQLLADFNAGKKYKVSLFIDDEAKEYLLNRELQLSLYRIVQEQLRNIAKHASATEVYLDMTINNKVLQMTITDNGVGFDVEAAKGGIGLANMNRRVQLFSGKLTIDSSVGNGCNLLIEIPVGLS